ncbi:MAG: VOC family protein [Gammaproteobacteria bacterium]
MFEPNAIVFYVDNLALSSHFYQELFGFSPEVPSATFRCFKLSNGMLIGLKDKHAQGLSVDTNKGVELSFTVDNAKKVDELFLTWQQKGIRIVEMPAMVSFGYTFIAIDPDGNRLRVISTGA